MGIIDSIHIIYRLTSLKRKKDFRIIDNSPNISVIIPAYNEETLIKECLKSVIKQEYDGKIEIIVVDDCSTDKTPDIVRKYGVKLISHERNMGRAKALENGMRVAKNNILVWLDADTILDKHALKNIVKHFGDNRVKAVCGNVIPWNRSKLWSLIQREEYAVPFYFIKNAQSKLGKVLIASGAFSAFDRSILLEVGCNSKTVAEDFDVTMKIHRKGYSVAYASDAIAYTYAPESVNSLFGQRRRWARGFAEVMLKHRLVKSLCIEEFFAFIGGSVRHLTMWLWSIPLYLALGWLGIVLWISYTFISTTIYLMIASFMARRFMLRTALIISALGMTLLWCAELWGCIQGIQKRNDKDRSWERASRPDSYAKIEKVRS
jgi:cellulose synthase/poly-beta-1,6-N-acetylglucosamine synthase-like glycosyltransferase